MAKAIICQLGCPAVSGFEGQFSRPVARAQLAMRRSAGTSVRARGSSVDPPDLRQLAKMAHIGITEQEVRYSTRGSRTCLAGLTARLGEGGRGMGDLPAPLHYKFGGAEEFIVYSLVSYFKHSVGYSARRVLW